MFSVPICLLIKIAQPDFETFQEVRKLNYGTNHNRNHSLASNTFP